MADAPEIVGFSVKELFLEIRGEVREVRQKVDNILLGGTQHSAQALKEISELHADNERLRAEIEDIKLKTATKDAVDRATSRITILWISQAVTWLLALAEIAVLYTHH